MSLITFEDVVETTPSKETPKKTQTCENRAEGKFLVCNLEDEKGWNILATREYYNVKAGKFGPCVAHFHRKENGVRYLACRLIKVIDKPSLYGITPPPYSYEKFYTIPFSSQYVERLECAILKVFRLSKQDPNMIDGNGTLQSDEFDPSQFDASEFDVNQAEENDLGIIYVMAMEGDNSPKRYKCLLSHFRKLVNEDGEGGAIYKCYSAYSIKFSRVFNND